MYNSYFNCIYPLYESNSYDEIKSNEDYILKLGDVDVYISDKNQYAKVPADDIIKVVSDALYKMHRDYPYLYHFLASCKLMYTPTYPSNITNTMCADSNGNLWVNMTFVYDSCKMDTNKVFVILFHEMFHIFFSHLYRFNQKYPKELFAGDLRSKANQKANLCMDYEVNASMVDDGIATADFFKSMNGLYKKEYTGMTWEEIMDKYGDAEYEEWLKRNGYVFDDLEMEILKAIEKASKVLLDPASDDEDKKYARKEMEREIADILGESNDEDTKGIRDLLKDLQNSKLGDFGNISMDLDDVMSDLLLPPESMDSDELRDTMKHIDRLMDDMSANASDIADSFGKETEDVITDVVTARKALKDAIKKINEGGLSDEEKADLIDKAKDALEDIISDDAEKERLNEERAKRDAEKERKRIEKLKKNHPFRKIIIVMKNLKDLRQVDLISDGTEDILQKNMDILEKLTEKTFGEMKKSDFKPFVKALDELKESLLPDFCELIHNDTILNKDEDDMEEMLEAAFDHIFEYVRDIMSEGKDDETKATLSNLIVSKLRIIGKILKTQKKWRVSDEFKDGYKDEMKELMRIFKEDGEEALFKKLYDMGVINPMFLDANGWKLLVKVTGSSIPTVDKEMEGDDEDGRNYSIKDDDDIEPFEGTIYYDVAVYDDEFNLWLSDERNCVNDSWEVYSTLAKKFEIDFPEYHLEEDMEACFSVLDSETFEVVDHEELKKKLKERKDYKQGSW